MDEQTREITERVERESFVRLYSTAAHLGTGWHQENGVTGVWGGRDDDPGFSCLFDLDAAANPGESVVRFEHVFKEAGAAAIGVDVPEDGPAPVTAAWLAGRGYAPAYPEQVMVRPLSDYQAAPEPEQLDISMIGPQSSDRFSEVINHGFGLAPGDSRGLVFACTIGQPGWLHYLVEIDGHAAAAAVLFIDDSVADFFLAATVPDFRGRGAQTALIRRRLADAVEAGCETATAQAIMTSASPGNFARQGFHALYRRQVFGKQLQNG